jgi:hypothetical protein
MTPEEQAQAWAYRILHQTQRLQAETLKRSVPVPLAPTKMPERTKPGTRRVPHTPRGQGRRSVWSVS